MSLVYPRDMISDHKWSKTRLKLQRRQQIATTAGGAVTSQDLGPALWRGVEFETLPMPRDDADRVMADFLTLRGSVHSLLVHDVTRAAPRSYAGEDLSGVTVDSIPASRDALKLAGLPVGFVMSPGDFVSVETSVGGIELFRIVRARGGVTDGTGKSPSMEVEPHVRPSIAPGDAVTLLKPSAEMVLEPESLDDPYDGVLRRKIIFQTIQVIK